VSDILIQFLGLLALLGALAWGHSRWIRPHSTTRAGKLLLTLIVMTFFGGVIGSTGWWFDFRSSFPWDLPPLASRMLAAAGWAFGVATWMTLQRPVYRRVRLALLMLAVYLLPLLIAIPLFHLDRFNFNEPISTAFFILVLLLIAPTLWFLFRQPVIVPDEAQDSVPARPVLRRWLALVAILTALWGVALFVADNGPSVLIWVWPGDLLTSRLIGVMLLTIAVGAVYSLRYADTARVMLATTLTYGFGLALASLWNVLAGNPIKPSYVAFFGVIFVVSAVVLRYGQKSEDNVQTIGEASKSL
jgi:hypothetical protein